MRRLLHLRAPMLLAVILAGCRFALSEPSSGPCTRVAVTKDSATIAIRDPDTGAAVAAFHLAYQESHWEGSLDCFVAHEYDRQNAVVLTIRNVTAATISFEYAITHPNFRYSGEVTRLSPRRIGGG